MKCRILIVSACAVVAGLAAVPSALSEVVGLPSRHSATGLTQAISGQKRLVHSAVFSALPPWSHPAAVSTTPLAGFPSPSTASSGGRFGLLSSGDATLAPTRNNSTFTGREAGGPSVRGAYDVTIVRADLRVPSGTNCLSLDLRMLSDEYRESIGTGFGDIFVAELGESSWQLAGNAALVAPRNFATDTSGQPMTITESGFSAMSRAHSRGTTYDGATRKIRVATPVKPGERLLYLSILERGDRLYDTTVFLDNLRAHSAKNCRTRAL